MNKIAEDVSQTLQRAANQGKDEALSQEATLFRNVLQNPGSQEIVWTDPKTGRFLGHCLIRAASPQAMVAIVNDLVAFTAEQVAAFEDHMRRQKFGVPPGTRVPPVPPKMGK